MLRKNWSLLLSVMITGPVIADISESNSLDNDQVIVLPQVSVIASKVDASNVGKSTLAREQIDRKQATTVQELLDDLPGTSLSGSPRVGGQTISIWGFGGDVEDVQVRLDGAPKMFQKYQQGSLFIEPELLKAVEVNKGPHSALYGNGAFGGVINLETKDADDLLKPNQTVGAMVKYGFGTNNNMELYSGSVYAGGKDNPFDVVVNINKRRAGNMEDGEGNTFNYSGMNSKSGLIKLGYDFQNGHDINLTYILNKDGSLVPWAEKTGLFELGGDIRKKIVWRETDDETVVFKHHYISGDWFDTSFTLSMTNSDQYDKRPEEASKYSGSNMGNKSWTDYKTWFAELKNVQAFNVMRVPNTLTYGVQFQKEERDVMMVDLSKKGKEEYNNGYYQPWYMPGGTQTFWSAFIQDEIVVDRLTITPSLRYDYITNKGTPNPASRFNNPEAGHDYSKKSYAGFSPRLGLYYRLNHNTALFGDISHSFRAPIVDELYHVQSQYTSASAASRNLKPETINAIRVGFLKSFDGVVTSDDNLLVRTTLFHQEVMDNIQTRLGEYFEKDSNGDNLPNQEYYLNHEGYYVQGIEAELFYDAPRVFASLNFSIMDSEYKGTPRDPNGVDAPVNEVPPPEANMVLGYKWLEQDVRLGWRGKFVKNSGDTVIELDPDYKGYALYSRSKGYAVHGLFMEWEPKASHLNGLKAVVSVDNLFNKSYEPYLAENVPGMGRNVKATVSWKY